MTQRTESDATTSAGVHNDTRPGPGLYLRTANRWCYRCNQNVHPKGSRIISGLFVGAECLKEKEIA